VGTAGRVGTVAGPPEAVADGEGRPVGDGSADGDSVVPDVVGVGSRAAVTSAGSVSR
jgi:hypothetical protein